MWAKSVSAIMLAVLATATSAQTQTTPNLVYSTSNPAPAGAMPYSWSGFNVVNSTGGNTTNDNGAVTGYNPNNHTFMFGYNQGTVAYTYAINQALSNAGTGIQVQGYNYSWDINNNNYDNRQGGVDTLTARILTYAPDNVTIRRTDSWTYNTKFDWTTFSGTVNYITPGAPSEFGNMRVEFSGMDSGGWAGYYGPQVRNVNVSLNYGVDPCVTNPAYSPSCPGYNDIVTSPNLVPNPNHWTTNGAAINNTYAINQALGLSGSQVRIHGFDYGYQYNLGSSYTQCTAFNQDGSCSWTMTFNPQVAVNFSVKNSSGTTIHSQNHTHTGNNTGNQSRSYQYRFGTSQDLLNLGAIGFTGTTTGNSTLFGMTSQAVYTNDSCVSDPLISPSCPGYAAAYLTQQCTANPLYDQSCPGYAAAYLTQQCSISALYDPQCPGYAAAYLTYQCNISQLYSASCPGYQQAYFAQQCALDGLYDTACPNYADAYYVQQCTADPLYDSGCTGYAQAYALKYIVNTPTTSTNTAVTDSDPVASAAPVVADPIVNQAVTTTATSASPAQAATATVPLVAAPSTSPVTTAAASKEEKREETKTETASASSDKKDQPQTARQALAERRLAAARAKAVEDGKQLANSMGEAASLEAQVAVQAVVIQAMAFTPGFDAYGRVTLPDAQGYRPFEIYQGQRNVDNPAGRRFMTGSDQLHSDMVDQQYGGLAR